MDRETWKFINTFAPWVSALGTTAAVIVSLYLALRTARVKLRVSSGIYHMLGFGQKVSEAPEYFQVKATNHGFREAKVSGIMWRYGLLFWRRNMVMMPPGNPYSSTLPAKIEFGDEATFLFTLGEFEAGTDDTILKILRGTRFPRLACRLLRVGVYTTTGQEVLARIDPTVRDFFLSRIGKGKQPEQGDSGTNSGIHTRNSLE